MSQSLVPEDQLAIAASCDKLGAVFDAENLPDSPGMSWVHVGENVAAIAIWLLRPLEYISSLVTSQAFTTVECVRTASMLLKSTSLVAHHTPLASDVLACHGEELDQFRAGGHERCVVLPSCI